MLLLPVIRLVQIREFIKKRRSFPEMALHARVHDRVVDRRNCGSIGRRVQVYGRIDKKGISLFVRLLRQMCPVLRFRIVGRCPDKICYFLAFHRFDSFHCILDSISSEKIGH